MVQPVKSAVLKSPFTKRLTGEGETRVVDVEVTTRVAVVVDMTLMVEVAVRLR